MRDATAVKARLKRPFSFFNDTATTEIYTLSLHELSSRERVYSSDLFRLAFASAAGLMSLNLAKDGNS